MGSLLTCCNGHTNVLVVCLLIRFGFCLNQEENEQAFQIIEVRILSNWGNQEYTCMYRLRVHGIPSNA